jgi:(+)-trans-carveol dehydrogenase
MAPHEEAGDLARRLDLIESRIQISDLAAGYRNHALRLAENGARIIAVDLCEQIASVPYPMSTAVDLRQTVSDVEQAGGEIIAREIDVRDFDALDATIRSAVEQFGRLDVVCANAGISSTGRLADLPAATWQDVIDVNLTGVCASCCAREPAGG